MPWWFCLMCLLRSDISKSSSLVEGYWGRYEDQWHQDLRLRSFMIESYPWAKVWLSWAPPGQLSLCGTGTLVNKSQSTKLGTKSVWTEIMRVLYAFKSLCTVHRAHPVRKSSSTIERARFGMAVPPHESHTLDYLWRSLGISLYFERLMIYIRNIKSRESNQAIWKCIIIAYICMPLYSFPQYFHKPLYFKLYFINIVCVCVHFPFSYPWKMFFFLINLVHPFQSH